MNHEVAQGARVVITAALGAGRAGDTAVTGTTRGSEQTATGGGGR